MVREKLHLDSLLMTRFLALARRSRSVTTCLLIFYLLLLTALNEIVVYNVGMITGEYYKVLADKNWTRFWGQTGKALVVIVALALIKSSKEYVASTVTIEWRARLTKLIHLNYFSDLTYYKLNVIGQSKLDNVDQRITQDIDQLCRHLSVILPELIIWPFTLAFYTYRSFVTIGWVGPLGCLIFFLVSTLFNRHLISLVLRWVYLQQKCEGDFRYQHLHVRKSAESIAFLGGHAFEYNKSETLFNKLIGVQERLLLNQFYLKSSVYLCDYSASIMSFLVLSMPLFTGQYDSYSVSDLSQLISQNAFVTMYLINCFTRVIDTSTDLADIGATTHRIAELFETLDSERSLDIPDSDQRYNHNNDKDDNSKVFMKLTDVSIGVPKSDRLLISDINVEIKTSENLLICGDSGTAKTSILRLLRGLWQERRGSVERYLSLEEPNAVLFLPQTPLMTTGSLLQQISYPLEPNRVRSEDMDEIMRLISLMELNDLVDRFGGHIDKQVDSNWADSLSPGEQQRISFVRLFYHKPLLAVLDESTSAVSLQMERTVYEECQRLGITVVSCGHRQSLRQYHNIWMSRGDDQGTNGRMIMEQMSMDNVTRE